jgi:hypothetical protein
MGRNGVVLAHPDARGWIGAVFNDARSFEEARARCVAAGRADVWIAVNSSLAEELLLPWLRGDPSGEAICFADALRRTCPELLQECARAFELSFDRETARARAKRDVLLDATLFFTEANKATLVEPMARALGHIPGSFHEPACFLAGDGTLRVVGGARELFPEAGPLTKYDALFDRRPCFDGIRWSFLVSADTDMQIRSFATMLVGHIEGPGGERVDVDAIPMLTTFLAKVRACDALHLQGTLPHDFESRAWPAYVSCVQDPRYWLSCDELLFFCLLGAVSVAVFERRGDVLRLTGSHLLAGAAPVAVKVDGNRSGRVRSHFERLVLRARPVAKAKARAAPEMLFDPSPLKHFCCEARAWQSDKTKPVFQQCSKKRSHGNLCGLHSKKIGELGLWDPQAGHASLPVARRTEGEREAARRSEMPPVGSLNVAKPTGTERAIVTEMAVAPAGGRASADDSVTALGPPSSSSGGSFTRGVSALAPCESAPPPSPAAASVHNAPPAGTAQETEVRPPGSLLKRRRINRD